MIWIKTTMGTLRLAADELRTISALVQDAPGENGVCKEQCYLALTLKNGERHLISTGPDSLRNAEMDRQFHAAFRAAAASTEPEPIIDMDRLMRECGDPPYTASKLISGKESEALLAQRFGRQIKFLRTLYWQIAIDLFDCDVSKTRAFFAFHNDRYDSGAISEKAYGIINGFGCWPNYSEKNDQNPFPLRIGDDYCIRIRTGSQTYLIRTSTKQKINDRCFKKISDWLAGKEPLLELTAADGDGIPPVLVPRKDTPEMLRYLYEFGTSPILP